MNSHLSFMTCGSVDDGKSTLMGRLLYELEELYDDQMMNLEKDNYDFSLLMDGLLAEREQKITIDVAYRYFSTSIRRFRVADCPGHVQYIRNMVTAASNSQLAVILIDITKGFLSDTRKHIFIAQMMGIQHFILVFNKMDLVSYQETLFLAIAHECGQYFKAFQIQSLFMLPVSACYGDNVVQASLKMPWYEGPTLIDILNQVEVANVAASSPFAMYVQWINRTGVDFRGITGQISLGCLHPGDRVRILPSNQEAHIDEMMLFEDYLTKAQAGQSILFTLKENRDVSRGDLIVGIEHEAILADELCVDLIWFSLNPFIPHKQYVIKLGPAYYSCRIMSPDYVVDVDTLQHHQHNGFLNHQIGQVMIHLNRVVACGIYAQHPELGSFVVADPINHEVLAAGMIKRADLRNSNIPKIKSSIQPEMRAALKQHQSMVIWFTGISGAGKSTIANLLEIKLHEKGFHTMLLDANNIRHGLNRDLGFCEGSRIENVRRIAEVAKLMQEAGLITLVTCIAPSQSERAAASELIGKTHFIEVFVDLPIALAEKRDERGLYAKARNGEIAQFTGIHSHYERPQTPDIYLDTEKLTAEESADIVLKFLDLM